MNKFMKIAIEEATAGIENGDGGPFGSVIVKDGKVIAKGHNRVLTNHDPSCHGEIDAIRKAGEILKTHDLSGCDIYTTGEPCHMCLCACLWANLNKIYYGATIADNSLIGFRDDAFNEIFGGREELKDRLINIDRDECLKLFDKYNKMNKTLY